MATSGEWTTGYARQAKADFETFERLQSVNVPECHKLQFLQMACEKLAKAYLCANKSDPATLQSSHAYVAKTLPVVLRQQAIFVNFSGATAQSTLQEAKRLCHEIEVIAPAVDRDGQRPDNCEYPWTDSGGTLHVPLDWTFPPSQLLLQRSGRAILKLLAGAIDRLL